MPRPIRLPLLLALTAAAAVTVTAPSSAASQEEVTRRTPNLSGGWVGTPGVLHFHFLHRFSSGDAPARKVSSAPTFLLAVPVTGRIMAGVRYATSSVVAPNFPNEWEVFGRLALLDAGSAPVGASATAAYNQAAESVDGAVGVRLPLGPAELLGTARAFSDGYGEGEARFAVGGGAVVHLTQRIALAGDVVSLVDREDGEELAWSAGVQLAIPFTPHSLSLHAANTASGTLQGASRGGDGTLWGFEFTVPLTVSRFFGGRGDDR